MRRHPYQWIDWTSAPGTVLGIVLVVVIGLAAHAIWRKEGGGVIEYTCPACGYFNSWLQLCDIDYRVEQDTEVSCRKCDIALLVDLYPTFDVCNVRSKTD